MAIKMSFKPSIICGALLAAFAAAPSYADMICEQGQIRALSSEHGAGSSFVVSTGMSTTAGLVKKKVGKTYGTDIWYESPTRFAEKYSLIKAAYATGSYIYIWTTDLNCAGNQDEFRIVVCSTSEECTP